MNKPSPGNVLVLIDLKDKDLQAAVAKEDEIWKSPEIRCPAGPQRNCLKPKSWNILKIGYLQGFRTR